MKKIIILVIFCVFISGAALADEDFISYSVQLSPTDLKIEEIGEGRAVYQRVTISENNLSLREPRYPELPLVAVHLVIPADKDVEGVEVLRDVKENIPGQFTIYPAQKSVRYGTERVFIPPNRLAYSSSASYPGEIVKIKSEGYLSGSRIVTLHVYPLEYIPSQKQLILHPLIEFKVNLKDRSLQDPEVQSQMQIEENIRENKSAEGKAIIKSMLTKIVGNPQSIATLY